MTRHLWIDASAGVAGDMLLGALHDAGASLGRIQAAVDAVLPDAVRITADDVRRAGLRARKAQVTAVRADQPHRSWREIRDLLDGAPPRAAEVFARLAAVEAAVHGIDPAEVHFHEVGALDAIADVVGVCAALDELGIATVSASAVAVGSGQVRAAHGVLPVPAPAVAELAKGWQIRAGGKGELATPTGMALLRTLATACEDVPPMTVEAVGVGAGTRDTPDRPNVVRVLIGEADRAGGNDMDAVILEANVDDLDPRLWPGVLAGLLSVGADDAWLVPIVMKKGRPAHTLTALCPPSAVAAVRARIFRDTSTLGVRMGGRRKTALARAVARVAIGPDEISVKVGYAEGVIVQVMPEFDEVAALARELGVAERDALARAIAAATEAGLIIGARMPPASD